MKKISVYVVVHAFESHDMFLAPGAGEWEAPTVFGVYATRAEAKKHMRGEESDDYIVRKTLVLP